MRQAAFLHFGRVKFLTSKDDIQEADGEKSRGLRGCMNRNYKCFIQQTVCCIPATGRHHSRYSGYSRDLEKDSPSPQEFTRACRPGGHDDKERRLERLRGQHFSLLVPEGCVGSRGARRSAVTTACWALQATVGPESFLGGQLPAAANAEGGCGGQVCIRSEQYPVCWNPLSTLADPLSALGETSKLYCLGQHQLRQIAGDKLMCATCFKPLLGAGWTLGRS